MHAARLMGFGHAGTMMGGSAIVGPMLVQRRRRWTSIGANDGVLTRWFSMGIVCQCCFIDGSTLRALVRHCANTEALRVTCLEVHRNNCLPILARCWYTAASAGPRGDRFGIGSIIQNRWIKQGLRFNCLFPRSLYTCTAIPRVMYFVKRYTRDYLYWLYINKYI